MGMTHAELTGSDWSSTVDRLGGAGLLERETRAMGPSWGGAPLGPAQKRVITETVANGPVAQWLPASSAAASPADSDSSPHSHS